MDSDDHSTAATMLEFLTVGASQSSGVALAPRSPEVLPRCELTSLERSDRNRQAITTPVYVVDVLANRTPVGEPQKAVALNISTRGMAFLCVTPPRGQLVRVAFRPANQAPMEMIVRVFDTQPMGPYRRVSGQFVGRA